MLLLIGLSEATLAEQTIRYEIVCKGATSCNRNATFKEALTNFSENFETLEECSRQHDAYNQPIATQQSIEKKVVVGQDDNGKDITITTFVLGPRISGPSFDCVFRPYVLKHICGAPDSGGYVWSEAKDQYDGEQELAKLMRHYRSGEPFSGQIVVLAAHGERQETRYALCEAATVNGITTLPRNCVVVAIETPDRTLIRGDIVTEDRRCQTSGSFGRGGGMNVDFTIDSGIGLGKYVAKMKKALSDELQLSIELDEWKREDGTIRSVYITGVSQIRISKILSDGWREVLNVHMSLKEVKPGRVLVRATTYSMVNRLNTGNFDDYSGLTDAQANIYVNALDGIVEGAIRGVCGVFKKIDATRLSCY